jgi:hypothetical protein
MALRTLLLVMPLVTRLPLPGAVLPEVDRSDLASPGLAWSDAALPGTAVSGAALPAVALLGLALLGLALLGVALLGVAVSVVGRGWISACGSPSLVAGCAAGDVVPAGPVVVGSAVAVVSAESASAEETGGTAAF